MQSTAAAADEVEAVAEVAEMGESELTVNLKSRRLQETGTLRARNHPPSPAVEASLGIA